jgi:predicted ATPase
MSIRRLEVQGFRSLKNVVWEPGALNVVIGPNGSGKSNLLSVIDMLSHSARGLLGSYVQSNGGMNNILWDGNAEVISIDLVTPYNKFFKGNTKEFDSSYGFTISPHMNTYYIEDEILKMGDENKEILRVDLFSSLYIDNKNEELKIELKDLKTGETLLSQLDGPIAVNRSITRTNRYLTRWAIFNYIPCEKGSRIREAQVTRFEEHLEVGGGNLINVVNTLYSTNREYENLVQNAMIAAFGSDFDKLVFPPAADQRIQLRVRWKSLKRETSAADLSDGTIRFLFLITALAAPELPPVIAIDEPETGLHPSMFPIIAEYAAEASKRAQIIFTTHSSQFLDACSRFLPTVTVTKWQDGETVLKTIAGDELEQWLKRYTLGDLYRSGELESELVG